MELMSQLIATLFSTLRDLAPVVGLLIGFQLLVLRQPLARPRRVVAGFVFVIAGLTFFLVGLEKALFPIGRIMATQLASPEFVFGTPSAPHQPDWWAYGWVYLFAALIGFATTIAEPALIAVAHKASEASGGSIHPLGLRIAVAIGVAVGIALGTVRIVMGIPLLAFIAVGYGIVVVQTFFAPRPIIPLAYDSGGVTTSTVTVPLVVALGLGLSSTIPGRNPALDGFGLIALASLFPMMTVMGYAQLTQWRAKSRRFTGRRPKDEI